MPTGPARETTMSPASFTALTAVAPSRPGATGTAARVSGPVSPADGVVVGVSGSGHGPHPARATAATSVLDVTGGATAAEVLDAADAGAAWGPPAVSAPTTRPWLPRRPRMVDRSIT